MQLLTQTHTTKNKPNRIIIIVQTCKWAFLVSHRKQYIWPIDCECNQVMSRPLSWLPAEGRSLGSMKWSNRIQQTGQRTTFRVGPQSRFSLCELAPDCLAGAEQLEFVGVNLQDNTKRVHNSSRWPIQVEGPAQRLFCSRRIIVN